MVNENLESYAPDTLEEEFISQICECGHAMNGNDNEHDKSEVCYALLFHGSWKSCICKQARPANFRFIFDFEEIAA